MRSVPAPFGFFLCQFPSLCLNCWWAGLKLPAHRAGLPGKAFSFILCPLTPPIPLWRNGARSDQVSFQQKNPEVGISSVAILHFTKFSHEVKANLLPPEKTKEPAFNLLNKLSTLRFRLHLKMRCSSSILLNRSSPMGMLFETSVRWEGGIPPGELVF